MKDLRLCDIISEAFGSPYFGLIQGATTRHSGNYVEEEQRRSWPKDGLPLRGRALLGYDAVARSSTWLKPRLLLSPRLAPKSPRPNVSLIV